MDELRIGAYGGTFDPIHNGHIEVARAISRNFKLDQLLIVPAHRPPHKDPHSVSDAYHRYAMVALATLDEPHISASTIELEAPDKPYTFETVERLRASYGPSTKLFFVMGADSFVEIDSWREPARLLSSTNLIVAARPGASIVASELPAAIAANVVDLRGRECGAIEPDEEGFFVYLTSYVNHEISSTEIRRRVRDGEPINGFVPPRVADYIEKYELYRR